MRTHALALLLTLLVAPLGAAHPGAWQDPGRVLGPAETGVCILAPPEGATGELEAWNGHTVGLATEPGVRCHGRTPGDDPRYGFTVYASSQHLPGEHDGKALQANIRGTGFEQSITVPTPDALTRSDITDAYATIIVVSRGNEAVLVPGEDGRYQVRAWINQYTETFGHPIDLADRVGKPVALRIVTLDALRDGPLPPAYDCEAEATARVLVLCGTLGTAPFTLEAGERSLDVRLDQTQLAPFFGQPVALSLFVDVSDERYPLFGDPSLAAQGLFYEPGSGWYNQPKLPLGLSPAASGLDWAITPILVLPDQASARACWAADPDGDLDDGNDPGEEGDAYAFIEVTPTRHLVTGAGVQPGSLSGALEAGASLTNWASFLVDDEAARYAHGGLYLGEREVLGGGTDSVPGEGSGRTCPAPPAPAAELG